MVIITFLSFEICNYQPNHADPPILSLSDEVAAPEADPKLGMAFAIFRLFRLVGKIDVVSPEMFVIFLYKRLSNTMKTIASKM